MHLLNDRLRPCAAIKYTDSIFYSCIANCHMDCDFDRDFNRDHNAHASFFADNHPDTDGGYAPASTRLGFLADCPKRQRTND